MPETECPYCGGPLVALGLLGQRAWYRCRDCGLQLSLLAVPVSEALVRAIHEATREGDEFTTDLDNN